MIDYGFKAVRNALRALEQTTSDSAVSRIYRAAFPCHRSAAAEAAVRRRPRQRMTALS